MTNNTLMGVSIGLGAGWLNATLLGIPGWLNIAMMFGLAILAKTAGDL